MYDWVRDFVKPWPGSTWHTRHATELERFYILLSKVVADPDFDPEKMCEVMYQASVDKAVERAKHPFRVAIDRYAQDADAVRRYLAAVRKDRDYSDQR